MNNEKFEDAIELFDQIPDEILENTQISGGSITVEMRDVDEEKIRSWVKKIAGHLHNPRVEKLKESKYSTLHNGEWVNQFEARISGPLKQEEGKGGIE